jgi:hypothetical protein
VCVERGRATETETETETDRVRRSLVGSAAVGDGGNEVGMGRRLAAVRKHIPLGDRIACVVAVRTHPRRRAPPRTHARTHARTLSRTGAPLRRR